MNKTEHIWNTPINQNDLKVYQYGYEECEPNHSYGPASRDHYLLHFISHGKGSFLCNNQRYELSAGEGFLICPEAITSYSADEDEPWTYSWIGFNGTNAEYFLQQSGLNLENPIFSYDATEEFLHIFDEFKTLDRGTVAGQIKIIAHLYALLALMIENAHSLSNRGRAFFNSKESYIINAISYIETNFSRKLSVDEVTKYIGLNRSYFGVIFKDFTGFSPQNFIINFKISRAKKLLSDISMSIGDVARSVGYDDPLTFSKIFKKNVGISPDAYRKTL